MIAMPQKVLDAQMRMARYYMQHVEGMNTLYVQGGQGGHYALRQFDAESTQIEKTLAWLQIHADDDPDAEALLMAMLTAGLGVYPLLLNLSWLMQLYQKALAFAVVREDTQAQWGYLTAITEMYLLTHFEGAYDHGLRALALAQNAGNDERAAFNMFLLGTVCMEIGRNEEALDWLQRAQTFYLEIKHLNRAMSCAINLARLYMNLGQWDQANHMLRQTMDGVPQDVARDKRRQSVALLADLLERTGAHEEATVYRHEVLDIARVTGSQIDVVSALISLGIHYDIKEDFAASQQYYREALTLAERQGQRRQRFAALTNLGYSHYLLGEYALARDYTEAAVADLPDEQNYIRCVMLANLAAIYSGLQAFPQARQSAQDGMQLAKDLDNAQLQIMMVVAAVQVRVAQGQAQGDAALRTAVQWAGFVYAAPEAEADNRAELDKLRSDMTALLGEAPVADLLTQGAALKLHSIVERILNEL